MAGSALHFGVEAYTFSGATLPVFRPAKTVAECFKFRNKIGLDAAIEALKESRRTLDAFRRASSPLLDQVIICFRAPGTRVAVNNR